MCAELCLPPRSDGGPDSTQHATSEKAILDKMKYSVTSVPSLTPPGLFDETQTNEVDCILSTTPSLGEIPSYISAWKDRVRVMCGGSSPYSTVHQVIPGGHEKETVQGELMREQLENRITQVWINHV